MVPPAESDVGQIATANQTCTVEVPINIALIKYWGKRDSSVDQMLPLNDSISVTIDALYARTCVAPGADKDVVIINDKAVDCGPGTRFQQCLTEFRNVLQSKSRDAKTPYFEIRSNTNFPIEAGLASSAAGFAAIAFALGQMYQLDSDTVVKLARMGSGSACRSVLPGFVHWQAGQRDDGSDCVCTTIKPINHWSSLRAIIAVTSSQSKILNSTNAMSQSKQTSALLPYRVQHCVPKRVHQLQQAINERDFDSFADVVIRDSNQMHAICMDTRPALLYLSPASMHLIRVCEAFNERYGTQTPPASRVAYTFDAGPNCCILLEESLLASFMPVLLHYCPPTEVKSIRYCTMSGTSFMDTHAAQTTTLGDDVHPMLDAVQYYVVSTVGAGPKLVKEHV